MMETMLLLLLALGGSGGPPAASPHLAPSSAIASPVTGVWRGQWVAGGGRSPVPVEAVLAPGKDAGTLVALVVSGVGRERQMSRLAGRYDSDGAKLSLPSGGALRLIAEGASRLVGDIKGGSVAGFGPGDGALELTRVRR